MRDAFSDSPVRAILWDLDGTLTDSLHLIGEIANDVISANGGARLDANAIAAVMGRPIEMVFRLAFADLSADAVAAMRAQYRSAYYERAVPKTKLYRGARATLRAFSRAGAHQAIVTGKPMSDAGPVLRRLDLQDTFAACVGRDSANAPKPSPALVQCALGLLGVSPGDAVMIGDTPVDIQMAHNAGVRGVLVLWGQTRTHLPAADASARTWRDLRRILEPLITAPTRESGPGRVVDPTR